MAILPTRDIPSSPPLVPLHSVNLSQSCPSFVDRQQTRSDDVAEGFDRAFSISHHRRKEAIERQSKREWEEQERLRTQKQERAITMLSRRTTTRDKGILEAIVKTRNQAAQSGGPIPWSTSGHLPREDRAIYAQPGKRVFYWGS
jgi:hypothetical protein